MSEPIWNRFLTERDKAVFAASGELPEIADAGRPVRRALAVNDWDIFGLLTPL